MRRRTRNQEQIEMALPWDKREFRSWHAALVEGHLTSKQVALLEDMVKQGEASDVKAAAQMLDWQETVVDPDEHMYGV
jgi:hypothetical protein